MWKVERESAPVKPVGIVQSVDRALNILEHVASFNGGIRLSNLAQNIGLPVSTVHRLLTTLEERQFVQVDRITGKWTVGETSHTIGSAFAQHENLKALARPFLNRLRDETRETANLGYVRDGETVTLAQAESREIMRAISPPGGRVPILNSGMGKALVAHWPAEEIDLLIERSGLRPLTSKSLPSKECVVEDLKLARIRGYAVDDEEYVVGMRCVAAPIWTSSGEPTYAMSISGLAARVTRNRVHEVAKLVSNMADELSTLIRQNAEKSEAQ